MTLTLLLALACSDYDLKRDPEATGADDTASAPGDTDAPVAPGDPGAELEGALYLVSECLAGTSDTLLIHSVGDVDLTVSEVNVLSVSDGTLTVTPGATLPAIVPPGDSLTVVIAWSPDAASEMTAELEVVTDDPRGETQVLDVAGLVVSESTPPVVAIEGPECTSMLLGDPLYMSAIASDSEDPPEALWAVWESELAGVLQEGWVGADGTSELSVVPPGGEQRITVTVTDSCGLSAISSYVLDVTDTSGSYPGPEPDGLSFDDQGYLWIADFDSDRVYQVDPATLGIIKELALPYSGADGLTWMDGVMLVSFYSSNQVVAIDPCNGAELDSFPAPGSGVSDVSWDGSRLWLTDYTSRSIYQVDPTSGAVLDYYSAPFAYPNGLAWDGSSFWLTANSSTDKLARLDVNFIEQESYAHTGSDPRGVAWDGADIWYSDGTLWIIDTLD